LQAGRPRLSPQVQGGGVELSLTDTAPTLAAFPFAVTCNWPIALEAAPWRSSAGSRTAATRPMPYSFWPPPLFQCSRVCRPRRWPQPRRLVKEQPVETLCGVKGLARNTVSTPDLPRRPPRPAAAAGGWRLDLLAAPAGSRAAAGSRRRLALELQPTPPFDLAVIWTNRRRSMLLPRGPWTAPRGA